MTGSGRITVGFSATGSDTTAVIAAAATKRYRILGLTITCTAAFTVTLKSGTTAFCDFSGTSGGPIIIPPHFIFECALGEAFNLTMGTATAATGFVTYELVPS